MSTALRSVGRLDLLSTTPAAPAGCAPCIHARLRRLAANADKVMQRFLVYIGWQPAPSAGKLEVVTRKFLPREFTLDLSAKELPALYRHFFPVA